jgi:hypothetical protein
LEFEINDVDDEDDTEEYKGIEVERKGKEGDNAIIKKLMDPRKPSEQEVEDHELYPRNLKGGAAKGGWQRLEIINKIMNVGNDFLK